MRIRASRAHLPLKEIVLFMNEPLAIALLVAAFTVPVAVQSGITLLSKSRSRGVAAIIAVAAVALIESAGYTAWCCIQYPSWRSEPFGASIVGAFIALLISTGITAYLTSGDKMKGE